MLKDVTWDNSECSSTYHDISYPIQNPETMYEQEETFFGDQIKDLWIKYPKNAVISYLKINSI